MKRLRSSEDLDAYGKDLNPSPGPNPNPNPSRTSSSSSHRSFYYNTKPAAPTSSAAARSYDDERDAAAAVGAARMVRKRPDHDFDRRKGLDRYSRDGGGYDRNSMRRSESFCGGGGGGGSRREFPKGFRSERDRPRREGSGSLSWRRFGKEFDEGGGARPEERSGKPLRSPSWSNSRDSGSDQSRVRSPPRRFRDGKSPKSATATSKSKSPTWSKDSVGSEQSKSVEVKKREPEPEPQPEPEPVPEPEPAPVLKSVPVPVPVPEPQEPEQPHLPEPEPQPEESGSRTTSEMEEGELQPEAEAAAGEEPGAAADVKGPEMVAKARAVEEKGSSDIEEAKKKESEGTQEEKKADELSKVEETRNVGGGQEVSNECKENVSKEVVVVAAVEEEGTEDNGFNLEVKAEDDEMTESDREVTEDESAVPTLNLSAGLTRSFKDKGKMVVDSAEDGGWSGRESRELLTSMDNDMEGPSTRGFELFTSSPVRRQEKADSGVKMKDEKLVLEPLDLSLSLPNVLLPIGVTAAPGSPDQARSVQSLSNTFCTNSDGFTQSVSFSGSQSFYHNPSCSLTTQNSMDFEQSVKSRPLFQGIDWQALAQNEAKGKEVPFYQKAVMNGNGSHPQSGSVTNGQSVQGQQLRHPEGSSKLANGFERQLSFHKQLSGGQPRHNEDVRSPSQSVGSHEMGSNYSFDRKRLMREKSSGSLYRTSSQKEKEFHVGGADFIETIIARIISDPIHVMAKKFHDMTGQSAACVKESIREIMLNGDKRKQIIAFQKSLRNRSDITLEMLLKAHRAQLEILVALRTGLADFLKQESSVSSSDLAEIFLCLRCRNPSCRSPVPVDECDCKVCLQKNGFCSACMCLVCSKFDMASNTCSWIGCDVCLHWCHADCALRESYIRNGRSATGSQGTTEMQFHCVACDHPSEMFGFVKEVFQNFAKDWTIENLARELEYVKRIFVVSKDMRGRRLYEIADQALGRLANKSDLPEVYSYIMAFLVDADNSKLGKTPILSGKDQGKVISGIAGTSQEPAWLKSVYTEKAPQLESATSILPSFNYDQHDKRIMESELLSSSQKEPVFDELESIVRIKQAEAKMFQTRADEARKEAEGLKRIAQAKNEKIEEEYRTRITKLRYVEAEEMRKQKLDELQALDRAHREYSNMKMRMEADIKDLLIKMEATKRNLPL